jgi:hypothetical protein
MSYRDAEPLRVALEGEFGGRFASRELARLETCDGRRRSIPTWSVLAHADGANTLPSGPVFHVKRKVSSRSSRLSRGRRAASLGAAERLAVTG